MDETLNGFLVAARENEAESLNENTQMVCLLEKMTAALRDAAGLNPDLTRKGLNPLEAIEAGAEPRTAACGAASLAG
jgi:hypothetical protein